MNEASPGKLLGLHVNVVVKQDSIDAFIAASLENAKNSLQEPLIEQFELSQHLDDPTQFRLVEVYQSLQGIQDHGKSAHYLKWRETVAPMMAQARSKKVFDVFPSQRNPMPASTIQGQRPLAMHVDVQVNPNDVDAFIAATLTNATGSIQEDKVTQFELSQEQGNPTTFRLYEVYADDTGPGAHKETAHYQQWRENVASMMAVPRSAVKSLVCSL